MQLTDWPLVEVALLLIGLTKISETKSGFDHPSVIGFPTLTFSLQDKLSQYVIKLEKGIIRQRLPSHE
jgi:hypothetical protein